MEESKINRLRGRMGEIGINVAELSRRTGLSRFELYFILKGERTPHHRNILKICEALKIDSENIAFYFPHYVPKKSLSRGGADNA